MSDNIKEKNEAVNINEEINMDQSEVEENKTEEVIEEVIEESMDDFMEQIDKSMNRIYPEDILKGRVISVNDEEVIVNIGYIMDGIITREEFSEDGILNPRDIVNVGDEINAFVVKVDDGEGNIVLSRKRAERIVVWDDLQKFYDKEEDITVGIDELVKGGALAHFKGVRIFIPASHVSASYTEDLTEYIGVEMKIRLIEFDKDSKKVVGSRKVVEKEELDVLKNNLWSVIKIGEKRNGVVRRLEKYGAFVDIGGTDGLLHISEMSFKRILHPSEVMSEGDKIEVIVQDFDKEKGRISLKLAVQYENPWDDIYSRFNVGDIVEGNVVRLKPFGAFIDIGEGIEGLLHISEISEERVNKVSDVLKINQKVEVAILDIKQDEKRISLSIKEALNNDSSYDFDDYEEDDKGIEPTLGDLFKDKFDKLKF
ncbi:30S ribosomal protein S1 [Helicovermis profundi]|uniref:30S ribosomal protein S1 n=1 Tax=Helicovermis profundi TaxID=3065157 RepID=A0AAU9ET98_9FIRM|nr:30S ribosomal protein S1 [Clostridia bacterium S502]